MRENDMVKLEESCLPTLESGRYRVTAHVDGDFLGRSDSAEETFLIDGPRFRLSAEELVSVYPANGMQGSFGAAFAHAVFGRRTLPWERSIEPEKKARLYAAGSDAPSGEPPWLCVLLLRDAEIVPLSSGKAGEVTHPGTDTYFPAMTLEPGEEAETCGYIDLPRELFLAVAPTPKELALLCHARRVDPAGRAANATPREEWVSAVVGNRLPASGAEGIRNRAYLVSLEGYGNYSETLQQANFAKVRLLVLHSWEFYSVTEPLHFQELCGRLDIGRLCVRAEQGTEAYRDIAANGYLPMVHSLREGSQTVSFYRGPLVPGAVQTEPAPQTWCPDSLYNYDPAIGMFDVSYAAAWQLGRLLALGNQAAAGQIQNLRAANKKYLQREETRRMLRQAGVHPAPADDSAGSEPTAKRWLAQALARKGGTLL